ncbi:MAG: FAD-dependent oxidoreductase [Chloroflexi bacterium]|nr:FAD-dependent oxidoreductase [Chloroflexota bacterium]MCY3937941.1 FAD-dependent oxidoreductase [Chloroflexota bacterium]
MATIQASPDLAAVDLPRFTVQLPDIDYYRSNVDCAAACPVHTDARGYVTAIERGDYEEAWWIARQPNPFASICGWICAAPCESACRRGRIDEPIGIRGLKRFANQMHGVLRNPLDLGNDLKTPQNSKTAGSISAILEYARKFADERKTGASVAIVGAGPAGLTAAHDLSLMGHRSTIFEASSAPGGAMYLAVPEHRVDRQIVAAECQAILEMPGVDIHYKTRIGEDIGLSELRARFDAVVLTTGLWRLDRPAIPGANLAGVVDTTSFVADGLMGEKPAVGEHVIVIGDDDSAFDAARSAVRLQLAAGKTIDVKLFSASTTKATLGENQQREAELEGISVYTGWELVECLGNGHAQSVKCRPTVRNPEGMADLGVERDRVRGTWEAELPADTVILSSLRGGDLGYLEGIPGIKVDQVIKADASTGRTGATGLYSGGDVVSGPATIIDAVQAGHVIARSVEEDFQEQKLVVRRSGRMTVIPPSDYLVDGYLDIPRQTPDSLETFERTSDTPVELAYDERQARTEAARCLKCNVNTVFSSDMCILCNLCVDVCPYDCLQLVGLDSLKGHGLDSAVKGRYGLGLDFFRANSYDMQEVGTALMKDDDVCTRCGLCVERCPTDVITMEWFSFDESLELAGAGAI